MRQRNRLIRGLQKQFGWVLAGLMVMSVALPTYAQSGSRRVGQGSVQAGSGTRGGSVASDGSGSRTKSGALALRGYCPVCVVEMKKWVKGNPQFAVEYDGKTYLFPSQSQMQMFQQHPEKYVPALGGDCVVALVEMGKRVPGSLQYTALHRGRLYLFANEQAKQMFFGQSCEV